jgi:hypothetical protein
VVLVESPWDVGPWVPRVQPRGDSVVAHSLLLGRRRPGVRVRAHHMAALGGSSRATLGRFKSSDLGNIANSAAGDDARNSNALVPLAQRRPRGSKRQQDGGGSPLTEELVQSLLSEIGPPPPSSGRRKCAGCTDMDIAVALCLWLMGMSAFPLTETLLLQSTMFARCFQWPGYYGMATVALFLPGLLIQLLQNRFDKNMDLRFGSRLTSTFRLLFGHGIQLVAVAAFLALLHNLAPDPLQPASTMRTVLLLVSFTVIGFGCATVYGTSSQLISLFPPQFHAFFFIGTYSGKYKTTQPCTYPE